MRRRLLIFLLLFTFGVISCGGAVTNKPVKKWVTYNRKTFYDYNDGYLTVRHSSYTFLDKSAELIPVAKSAFHQIAQNIAKEKNMQAKYNEIDFYISTGYDGISGISTVIVSNNISLVSEYSGENAEVTTDSIESKLIKLREIYEKGLITEDEYLQKRKQILSNY